MKYIVSFGKINSGLTPLITVFVRLDTMEDLTPPSVTEIAATGAYVFDYTPIAGGVDIFFQVDGGLGLNGDNRYREGVISSADTALDQLVPAVDGIATRQGLPADPTDANTEFGRLAAILDMGPGGGGSDPNVGASTDAVGAPTVFGKIYEARDAITARTNLIPVDFGTRMDELKANITRLLGLTKENSVLDQTVFDARNNLTSARVRLFASKTDAVNMVNPTATYTVTASYVAGTSNIQAYSMVRDS